MQSALVLIFALIAIVVSQTDPGGCCFYRKPNFVDEIRCTSEPTIDIKEVSKKDSDEVGSFYCTETFSAAIQHKGEIKELAECGDVVDATTALIPCDRITIGECLLRRCCFYTGVNKDGDEFCVNSDSATSEELTRVQKAGTFRVCECTANWRANYVSAGKQNEVKCGETVDIPANTVFSSLTLTPCPAVRSSAEFEEVADTDLGFVDDVQFTDQAVADTFDETIDDTFADQYVDQAVDDTFADQYVDQAVGDTFDETIDDTFADQYVDTFADQAVDDTIVDQYVDTFADQAVADTFDETIDDTFADQYVDQAVGDTFDETIDDTFADQYVDQAVDDTFADQYVDTFADQAVGDTLDEETFTEQNTENFGK